MGLSVQFKGPVMEIGWDRSSPAAKVAQSGRVDIRDGEQKVSVQLDTAQLAAGRVLYSPISSDTRIQLQMTTPDGFVQDMIRVLRVGRSSAAGAEENVSRARTVTTVAASTSSSSAPPVEEPITAAPIAASPAAATTAPVAGRVFVPPAARRQNTSVEPAVIEPPPQLTFASSALTQPSLPKLEVRAPSPSPSAPVKSVVAPPVPLGNLAVYVPPAARTADIAGREISVKVHVDSQGRIARIEPGQLSPRVVLAVTDAAKRWRFKPATASGKPVPSELIIHLKFPARR
jgi:protein TonB